MSKDIEDSLDGLSEITNRINQIDFDGLVQALTPLASISSSYHSQILNLSTGMLGAMESAYAGWEQRNLVNHIVSSPATVIQGEMTVKQFEAKLIKAESEQRYRLWRVW